jgi:hypothetical protein
MTWGGRAYVAINPWMTGSDLKLARLQIDFWTKHRGGIEMLKVSLSMTAAQWTFHKLQQFSFGARS